MALFEIKNLEFTYPEAKSQALSGLNLCIGQGEFVVICGKSGCGKTTLLRHLKSVMTPYGEKKGEIFFDGKRLEEVPLRRQVMEIGYVLQSPDNQIVTDKVWHELAFGMENLGYEQQTIRLRVAEMASFFGIQNWFSKSVEELSGGQKQILNLASVMVMQPKVLILDEPTSQLDPIAAGEFLSTIRKINTELGTTVILIEHRLEEVFPMADKVLALEEGKNIYFDVPEKAGETLAENDLFLAMPSPVQIYEGAGRIGECPVTVRAGRSWMETYFQKEVPEEKTVLPKRSRGRDKAVCVKELWFRYEKNGKDILKDLSLSVEKGEFFCVLGGNGTGKSTMLSVLAGIRKAYRGKISMKGRVGMLPQNPQSLFVGNTVREDLEEMFDGKAEDERIEKAAKDAEITHLLDRHPYDLSGGEQQRAALAKVLLMEPDILLLDEPTKGLDGFYKQKLAKIFARLKERQVTIVMVSHDVEFCAAYADTCALFFDGGMIAGKSAGEFFAGNSFYTTAANRMARHLFPNAVTVKEVVELCRKNRRQD